jgi:hypothetical protein
MDGPSTSKAGEVTVRLNPVGVRSNTAGAAAGGPDVAGYLEDIGGVQ